jgi:hypothetical protein
MAIPNTPAAARDALYASNLSVALSSTEGRGRGGMGWDWMGWDGKGGMRGDEMGRVGKDEMEKVV